MAKQGLLLLLLLLLLEPLLVLALLALRHWQCAGPCARPPSPQHTAPAAATPARAQPWLRRPPCSTRASR